MNKKIILIVVLICTPIGWMWNWWHYNAGIIPAWGFPIGEVLSVKLLGIPLEDWAFYPITGGMFSICYYWDPLKFLFFKKIYSPDWLKITIILLLVWLSYFGVLIFGRSGTMTAVCFGFPAIAMFFYIYKTLDVWHFLRLQIIVIPTNVIWDIWATPTQWFYPKDSGIFSEHFWWLGIPAEMTPYLGIMAGYFIYGIIKSLEKSKKITLI